jgi:UDP:flavonoid glycosyltransferase YjiC (YdhE family)
MRPIVILTSGTRGDVQPLVALGAGLQAAGYPVRLASHEPFRGLVTGAGLSFTPLDANPSDLLLEPAFAAALSISGGLLRGLYVTVRFLHAARPLFARLLLSAWRACQGAGAIIVTLPTTWGCQIAAALGVPCIRAFVQPLGRTAVFPSPLLPLRRSCGPLYNRLSHLFVERSLALPWQAIIGRWRRDTLGLAQPFMPRPHTGGEEQGGEPRLFGFSPLLVPPPGDWPEHYRVTGYWFLDQQRDWAPPPALQAFLAAGPPPVYVGLGSTGAEQRPEFVALALAALARAGMRGILALGAAAPPLLPPTVFATGPLPHDWLFPQVAAVVHHGGAGTTGAALRAGIPSVCVPVAVDNFFWAGRLAAAGVAPPALPRRSLTAERLAASIATAAGNGEMRERAMALGAHIRAEDGVGRAVECIMRSA